VRIESIEHRHNDVTGSHDDDDIEYADDDGDVDMDIATLPHSDTEPLLLVFSNDRHHRRFDSRELHEMIKREMELSETGDLPAAATVAAAGLSHYDDDEYVDIDDYDADYYDEEADSEMEPVVSRMERDTAAVDDASVAGVRRDLVDETSSKARIRVRRAKFRRRMRRNICRRRPMYVNFRDIHWDGWIIEPKGYQVRSCSPSQRIDTQNLWYCSQIHHSVIVTFDLCFSIFAAFVTKYMPKSSGTDSIGHITKALAKTNNCTFRAKKVEGHNQKKFRRPPHFQIRSGTTAKVLAILRITLCVFRAMFFCFIFLVLIPQSHTFSMFVIGVM